MEGSPSALGISFSPSSHAHQKDWLDFNGTFGNCQEIYDPFLAHSTLQSTGTGLATH